MSGHPTYQPQSAFMQWMERRLPIAGLVYSSFIVYPVAAQPELLVDLRRHPRLHARRADRHRHRAGHALHAACRLRLQFRRADHARRELRLAAALPARQRRIDVLPRRLHPHVPRHVLRLLQGAARGAVDPRRDPAAAHDHDRLHGLRAAVGPDELLGGDRHHQPVLGDPAGRRIDRHLAVGRLRGRQSDAQSFLLAALPAAVRHRRRGGAAHLGAAHGRAEQSDRHRAEDRARTPSRSRPMPPSRTASSWWCSASCSPGSCSTFRTSSAIPTTTSRPIRR